MSNRQPRQFFRREIYCNLFPSCPPSASKFIKRSGENLTFLAVLRGGDNPQSLGYSTTRIPKKNETCNVVTVFEWPIPLPCRITSSCIPCIWYLCESRKIPRATLRVMFCAFLRSFKHLGKIHSDHHSRRTGNYTVPPSAVRSSTESSGRGTGMSSPPDVSGIERMS
jgi:hypothetical protein